VGSLVPPPPFRLSESGATFLGEDITTNQPDDADIMPKDLKSVSDCPLTPGPMNSGAARRFEGDGHGDGGAGADMGRAQTRGPTANVTANAMSYVAVSALRIPQACG
jgi:hypothetical protein